MSQLTTSPKARPYWHVDLKWFFGLLLLVVLNVLLLVYCLTVLTSEKVAVEAMSFGMATAFSPKGLDDPGDINKIKQEMKKNPNKSFKPPGLPVSVKYKDIANLSPREARLFIFRQVAQQIYDTKEASPVFSSGKAGGIKTLSQEVGVLAFLTREKHAWIKSKLTVLKIIALVLVAPLIFFSHRFGRLASPGFVLVIAGLPGALLFSLLKVASAQGGAPAPPGQGEGMAALAGFVARNVLPPVLGQLATTYIIVVLTGIVLIGISVLAGILHRFLKKRPVLTGHQA